MKTYTFIKAGLLTAAIALSTTGFAKDSSMLQSMRNLNGSEFDQAFLAHMTEHHRQGVEMANLAVERAQNAELKRFAQKTAGKQQEDIQKMESLEGTSSHAGHAMGSNHQDSSAGHMHAGASGSHHDMQAMENSMMSKLESASGAEFDRTFADQMIQHHQTASDMAELAKDRASNPEVKRLATKMLRAKAGDLGAQTAEAKREVIPPVMLARPA